MSALKPAGQRTVTDGTEQGQQEAGQGQGQRVTGGTGKTSVVTDGDILGYFRGY